MDTSPPPGQIINRLIEVTVDLHLERGDRQALIDERQSLLRLAKDLNLIERKDPYEPHG